MANTRLGQHFLKNEVALERIAIAVAPKAGDVVIEIGPGHGELTKHLLPRLEKVGGELIVIEKDKRLCEALRKNRDVAKSVIIEGDALKLLPKILEKHKTKSVKLVGNIPYYLTGFLLRIVSISPHKPTSAVFLIQKEVAERLIATPPNMNRLAAITQFWGEPKKILAVPKKDFSPPPQVDSAVVVIETRKTRAKIEEEKYYAFVKTLFAQPRKTLLNNLVANRSLPKETIQAALRQINIQENDRPQDLSIEKIIALAETLEKS